MSKKPYPSYRSILYSTLIVILVVLVILHVVSVYSSIYFPATFMARNSWLLDLDSEKNLPTIYSGLLLASCSALSFIIYHKTTAKRPFFWFLMGVLFIYLAFDELLIIHEQLALPLRQLLSIANNSAFFHAWVIPALVIIISIAVYLLLANIRIIKAHILQDRLLLYIFLLAFGATVLEIAGTKTYSNQLVYRLGTVVAEEGFEIGMISFIFYRLSIMATTGRRLARSLGRP